MIPPVRVPQGLRLVQRHPRGAERDAYELVREGDHQDTRATAGRLSPNTVAYFRQVTVSRRLGTREQVAMMARGRSPEVTRKVEVWEAYTTANGAVRQRVGYDYDHLGDAVAAVLRAL